VGFNVEKFKSKPPVASSCFLCSTCTLVSQLIGTIITNKYYLIALFIYNSRFVKAKEIGSPDEYFLEGPIKLNQYFLYMRKWFKFVTCLAILKRKINIKFLLEFLKTLLLKMGPKAASNFFSGFFALIGRFSLVCIHDLISEQFSQLVSDS
jgi:hypothetical protein